MINFTLSNFLEAKHINNYLYLISKRHPEWLKQNIVFQDVKGSFPFTSWNGGYNNSFGMARYDDFLINSRKSLLDFRLDFSNILLTEQDFYSRKENFILDLFKDTSLKIEISNLKLYEFLHKKYPNYYFVFSKNANFITPFTPELLNMITDEDKFLLISLPEDKNNDWEFLSALKHPSKFELTVNSKCYCDNCEDIATCKINENSLQLNFSGSSSTFCRKRLNYVNKRGDLNIEDLKPYINKGFNHFCLDEIHTIIYKRQSEKINLYLLEYFIKDEFLNQAIIEWCNYKENIK